MEMGKFKLKLNSLEKVEVVLQETYDDTQKQQNLILGKIAELENSTNLSEVTIEEKVKYAKAMHDYITDNEKIISRKIEISKLMSEILKANGNIEKIMSDKDIKKNIKLDDAFSSIRNKLNNGESLDMDNNSDEPEEYITNQTRK